MKDAAPAEQVTRAPAQQQKAAERERVCADYPLEARRREVEAPLDRRQRNVDDRHVEDNHQVRDAEYCERLPASWIRRSRRGVAAHEVSVTQYELELAWSREPVEGRSELQEHAGNEVLERPRVLQATNVLGLVAGVANQLLRDVARLVVSRIQAARPDALSAD